MKKYIAFGLLTVFLLLPVVCAAAAPHEIAGFVLNQNIEGFRDRLLMETALPVRYQENIEEVEIKPIKGYKTGLIGYATCVKPGHIVWIKMKYDDSSKAFFQDLLKQFKKRFGEPTEYRGDPFHIFVAWKWSFIDPDNNRISLTLQHNTLDSEEKRGTAVKLKMTNLIDAVIRCHNTLKCGQLNRLRCRKWKKIVLPQKGWDLYVPR